MLNEVLDHFLQLLYNDYKSLLYDKYTITPNLFIIQLMVIRLCNTIENIIYFDDFHYLNSIYVRLIINFI